MSDTSGSLREQREQEERTRAPGVGAPGVGAGGGADGDGSGAWVDSTEASIQRYLPYVVGILFALGFLVFGGVQSFRSKDSNPAADLAGKASGIGLAAQVEAAELVGGLRGIAAGGSGSRVTLRGTVASAVDKDRAEALALGVDGVRSVDNQLTIKGQPASFAVTAQATDDGVVLNGAVGSEAVRNKLVAAATRAYGAGKVTDRLTVRNDASADVAISMTGSVSAAAAAALRSDIGTLVGKGVSLDDQLTVRAAATTAAPTTLAPTTAAPTTAKPPVTTATPAVTAAPPPPAPTTVPLPPLANQLNDLVRLAPINFDEEAATIRPESLPTLDKVAAILVARLDGKVEVQGHTDVRGSDELNVPLSQDRANAVVQYLIAKGVKPDRFTAKGYGSTRLLTPGRTPQDHQLNRRIEFAVS